MQFEAVTLFSPLLADWLFVTFFCSSWKIPPSWFSGCCCLYARTLGNVLLCGTGVENYDKNVLKLAMREFFDAVSTHCKNNHQQKNTNVSSITISFLLLCSGPVLSLEWFMAQPIKFI
eukprot:scaffold1223_cov119-Cylindrotheca_fusiformis.AAC.14